MFRKRPSLITVFIVVALSLFIFSILYSNNDVGTWINFMGDDKDDVQAYSDVIKEVGFKWEFVDEVAVLEAAPDTLESLTFKWNISEGHSFSGTLPRNKKWGMKNYWYTYKYPIHKDFTLYLSPKASPAVSAFSQTAEAHHPWLPTDVITNLLSSVVKKGEVGGELVLVANVEKVTAPEIGMASEGPNIESLEDLENLKDKKYERVKPLSDEDEKLFRVYSTIEESSEGKFTYKYFAVNPSEYSITGEWTTYFEDIEEAWDIFEFTVEPNDELLLDEFESDGKPLELSGVVTIEIEEVEFTFFAPAFSAEEEEEETRVDDPEGVKKGKQEKKL